MPPVKRRMFHMRAEQLEDTESKMANISPETKRTPKFTLFPKLPAELRVKIWKLASQHERVVEIRTFSVLGKPKHSWSDTPPPSVLGTCRESRHEGLKYYKVLRVMSDTYYEGDDGAQPDAGSDGDYYEWDRYATDLSLTTRLATGKDSPEHPGESELSISLRSSKSFEEGDKVPTLRTYLNSPRNIVYFHTLHNCNIVSATNVLLCIAVQDVKIRNLALRSDVLDDNRFARCVIETALFPVLRKIVLVGGDTCCTTEDQEHRTVTDLVLGDPQDEEETTRFMEFKRQLVDDFKHLQQVNSKWAVCLC